MGRRDTHAPRRRGCGCGTGLLGLVVLIVVLLVAGEFGARWYLGDRIENAASEKLGAPVSASFGTTPVLLGLARDRSVDTVHLTSPGAGDVPALDVTGHHARLEDGNQVHADSADGTATLDEARLTSAAKNAGGALGGLVSIDSVKADPAAGVLRADIGGLAQVAVTPGVSDGKVTLTPQNGEVMGIPLPDGLFGGIGTTVDSAVEKLPEGVEVDSVRVVDGGLEAHLTGTDVTFR